MDDLKFEYYLKKKLDGTDYSVIREEMSAEGFSDEEIASAIREIDETVLLVAEANSKPKVSPKLILGWAIILFSILAMATLIAMGVRGGLIIIALLFMLLSGVAFLSTGRKETYNRIENKKWRK